MSPLIISNTTSLILRSNSQLLMCHFMFLSDMGGPRWVMMGIVVKMAQSVSSTVAFFVFFLILTPHTHVPVSQIGLRESIDLTHKLTPSHRPFRRS